MRSEDHLALGLYLLSRENSPQFRRHCIAFLIGCIEPDYNQFSYMRGIVHHRKFRGHNAENSFAFPDALPEAFRAARSVKCVGLFPAWHDAPLHGGCVYLAAQLFLAGGHFWVMSGMNGRCIRCLRNSCVQSLPGTLPALTRQVYMKPTQMQNTA